MTQTEEINKLVFELNTVVGEAERCVISLYNIARPEGLLKQTKKDVERLKAELEGLKVAIKERRRTNESNSIMGTQELRQ